MTTFTSSLPEDLLQLLAEHAKKHSLPKNALIEKALRIYLDQLTKAEYIQSYKRAAQDDEVLAIAEEGMQEYLASVHSTEGKS